MRTRCLFRSGLQIHLFNRLTSITTSRNLGSFTRQAALALGGLPSCIPPPPPNPRPAAPESSSGSPRRFRDEQDPTWLDPNSPLYYLSPHLPDVTPTRSAPATLSSPLLGVNRHLPPPPGLCLVPPPGTLCPRAPLSSLY